MPDGNWRPGADPDTLKARSRLLMQLRAFFSSRGYTEVETPVLAHSGTVDPNIDCITCADGQLFLHTSPEFAMKRLLAAGSGPIYQICHVFRRDEKGRLHNPEFSMLEWYRTGIDHSGLMDEFESLLQEITVLAPGARCKRFSYAEVFAGYLKIDPHTASATELEDCAISQGITVQGAIDSRDAWLDLLMGEIIGPGLGNDAPCFVYDYPASQSALARIRESEPPVAERFELYWQGVELANGFHELSDAGEQRRRFEADVELRRQRSLVTPPVDERFLAALEHGLPDCAGVALGIDRLLMLMLGRESVAEVMSFDWERI